MSAPQLESPTPSSQPPKKTKWYWKVLGYLFCFCIFGGAELLLLQDIPFLLFLLIIFALIDIPTTWIQSRMRQSGRQRRHWKNLYSGTPWKYMLLPLALLFIVYAGTFAVLTFVIPPFAISPQTTYLTEPRSKEFYGIDYAAFIEQQIDPQVPPEDNGFRLLIETFGRPFFSDKFEDKDWNRLCQYLDLPTDIEPKLTFVALYDPAKTLTPEEQKII
jgi:hypothetical protein